jgi:hypothetical protein
LENSPDTGADHEIGDDHVSWATSSQSFSSGDEDTRTDVGT